jgi:Flp pilus assembly pilin Flp
MSKLFASIYLAAHDIRGRLAREDGQSVLEYALIVGLVVAGAAALLVTIGSGVTDKLQDLITAAGF